jgi:receptor protein-tyrosine kinase
MDAGRDEYRILAMNLSFAGGGGKPTSILLCRASEEEPTISTAVNLAVAMAEAGRTTILVDADTRAPGLHRALGMDETPGLTDVLRDDVTLERALRPGLVPGLSILAAGTTGATVAPLVNPALARRLDAELKVHADCVIYHGPPVLVAAEVLQLATVVDGIAYVITEGKTRQSDLAEAAGMLAGVHANVLGFAIHHANRKAARERRGGAYLQSLLRSPGSLLRLWSRSSNGSPPNPPAVAPPPRAMPEPAGAELAKGGNDL